MEFHDMNVEEINLIQTKIDDIIKFGSMEGFTGMQPKQIGNYTLVEIIVRTIRNIYLNNQGKGGYGTVFVGKKGENSYAIKEVPLD